MSGGLLVQTEDDLVEDRANYKVVTKVQTDRGTMESPEFAWNLVKHVKSNAILISNGKVYPLGVGAGQMNRVGSAKMALEQSWEAAKVLFWHPMHSSLGDTVETRPNMALQPLFNQVALFAMKNPSKLLTKRALPWYLQIFATLSINWLRTFSGLLNTIRVKYLLYGQQLLIFGVVSLCVYIIINLMAF